MRLFGKLALSFLLAASVARAQSTSNDAPAKADATKPADESAQPAAAAPEKTDAAQARPYVDSAITFLTSLTHTNRSGDAGAKAWADLRSVSVDKVPVKWAGKELVIDAQGGLGAVQKAQTALKATRARPERMGAPRRVLTKRPPGANAHTPPGRGCSHGPRKGVCRELHLHQCERGRPDPRRRAAHAPRPFPTRRARPHRRACRLRYQPMRRLHCPAGRRGREVVLALRRTGRGPLGHHHRRAGTGRKAPSHAAGVLGPAWPAVRILHAG